MLVPDSQVTSSRLVVTIVAFEWQIVLITKLHHSSNAPQQNHCLRRCPLFPVVSSFLLSISASHSGEGGQRTQHSTLLSRASVSNAGTPAVPTAKPEGVAPSSLFLCFVQTGAAVFLCVSSVSV